QKQLKAIDRCVDILPLAKFGEAFQSMKPGTVLNDEMAREIEKFANQIGKSLGLTTYQLSHPNAIENILTALRYLSEQEVTGAFTASNILQTYVLLVIFVFVTPGMIENIIHDYEPDYINQLTLMVI